MINRDKWIAAIEEAERVESEPDAITVREYKILAKCGKDKARARLEAMCAAGRARRVTKVILGSNGAPQHVNAYVLVDQRSNHCED